MPDPQHHIPPFKHCLPNTSRASADCRSVAASALPDDLHSWGGIADWLMANNVIGIDGLFDIGVLYRHYLKSLRADGVRVDLTTRTIFPRTPLKTQPPERMRRDPAEVRSVATSRAASRERRNMLRRDRRRSARGLPPDAVLSKARFVPAPQLDKRQRERLAKRLKRAKRKAIDLAALAYWAASIDLPESLPTAADDPVLVHFSKVYADSLSRFKQEMANEKLSYSREAMKRALWARRVVANHLGLPPPQTRRIPPHVRLRVAAAAAER